jgi:hypothetical protein
MIKFDGKSFYKDENGDYTKYQACLVGFRPEEYPTVNVDIKLLDEKSEGTYPLSELLRWYCKKDQNFINNNPIIIPMNYLHPDFKEDLNNLTNFIRENYCFRGC